MLRKTAKPAEARNITLKVHKQRNVDKKQAFSRDEASARARAELFFAFL